MNHPNRRALIFVLFFCYPFLLSQSPSPKGKVEGTGKKPSAGIENAATAELKGSGDALGVVRPRVGVAGALGSSHENALVSVILHACFLQHHFFLRTSSNQPIRNLSHDLIIHAFAIFRTVLSTVPRVRGLRHAAGPPLRPRRAAIPFHW